MRISYLIYFTTCWFVGLLNNFTDKTAVNQFQMQDSATAKSDTNIYMIVQIAPKFPGGDAALSQFIQSNSVYPITTKRNKDSKTVNLKLLVEKNGSISKVAVMASDINNDLVEEAKRIVSKMPEWKPGSQNGRLLRVNTIVSFHFK